MRIMHSEGCAAGKLATRSTMREIKSSGMAKLLEFYAINKYQFYILNDIPYFCYIFLKLINLKKTYCSHIFVF